MDEGVPPELAAALAAAGLPPGADGYEATALRAAAVAWGLAVTVEEIAGTSPRSPPGRQRYRALVHRVAWGTAWSARGRGRTEAEALATALLKWRRRHPRDDGAGGDRGGTDRRGG